VRFVAQSAVSIAIGDRTRYEGNSGTANALFTVRLSAPRTAPVSVAWRTTDGSAKAGTDYIAANGRLTFPAGTTLRTIPVAIRGDTAPDLSAPSGASIADAPGIGTIRNDDGAGTVAFDAASYQKAERGAVRRLPSPAPADLPAE